jgi:hypothetical protein
MCFTSKIVSVEICPSVVFVARQWPPSEAKLSRGCRDQAPK